MAEEDNSNDDFELQHCLSSENLVSESNMKSASDLDVTKILKANRNSKPSRKRKAKRNAKMSKRTYKEKDLQVSESDEMNEHAKVLKKSIQNRNEKSLCEQEDACRFDLFIGTHDLAIIGLDWLTGIGCTEENLEAQTIYNELNERFFVF